MIHRILHVLQDNSGGAVTHALDLARHSTSHGVAVTLAVPGEGLESHAAWSADEAIRIHPLPHHLPGRVGAILRHAAHADVVHAHGIRAGTWALPALCARPSVVTFHGLHPLRRPGGRRRW